MGIRIHKILGYGLTDVKTDPENGLEITDERFNPRGWFGGYMGDDDFNEEEHFSREGFLKYIEEKHDAMDKDDFDRMDYFLLKQDLEERHAEGRKYWDVYTSVVWDGEFGEPNIMLFVPPGSDDWQRYDNIIDYYDPVNSDPKDGIISSLIPIDRPLWPYESWINIREMPPKRLNHMQQQSLYTWRNIDRKRLTEPEILLRAIGVETEEELKTCIAPIIPTSVVELIKYLKIFNDERHIYELRPMIYGYWG